MSGLAGIFNLDGRPVDTRILARMTAAMAFRGPDSSGEWIGSNVGLTHTMLRTTSGSVQECQPLLDESGNLCIVFDGRIDDRSNLMHTLKSHGATLRDHSDAELVLRAYQVWGEECPKKVIGDFAFAIWDGCKQRLFCARDPLGLKPFFYARLRNSLVFGNTIQALKVHPGITDELNEDYLADFLLFSVQQDMTVTAYHDISRLAPAHCLSASFTEFRLKKYWQLPDAQELTYKREEDYVQHFRELLSSSVADRLRTDRLSVLMSGGLDSPSIAATAQQIMAAQGIGEGLRALCIHHNGTFRDPEKEFADVVARHLNIPLQFLDGSSVKLYSPWQGRNLRTPEPVDLPMAELFLRELEAVSDWGRVVLTGYDGDTLFETNLPHHLGRQLRSGRIIRAAKDSIHYARIEHSIPPVGFRSFLKWTRGTGDFFRFYPRWLNPDFERRCNLRERWLSVGTRRNKSVHPGIWRMSQDGVWPALFEGYDAGQTGIPLEYRHPLTDLRVVHFCLALPPVPWCLRKRLLRLVMKGILPDLIISRPKTPLAGHPEPAALIRGGLDQLPSLEPAAAYVRADLPLEEAFGTPGDCRVNLRPYSLAVWLNHR